MKCRQVAADVWLGFARCLAPPGASARGQRWARAREAADRAVAVVLEASGYHRNACVTSRSHTRGFAAAVVAPAGVLVGVDLVPVDRVGSRHAGAILGGEEWEALAPYPTVRPALAWALKESAAKAMGDPLRRFPHGIRIDAASGGVTLTALESETIEFAAGWGMFDGFLYAWVRGRRRVVPAIVILSEAKEPCPGCGSFASLRMTDWE
jgi:phosphopantetheinyl transferase (holo-ACP synthase)